jgi:hypothetical protein
MEEAVSFILGEAGTPALRIAAGVKHSMDCNQVCVFDKKDQVREAMNQHSARVLENRGKRARAFSNRLQTRFKAEGEVVAEPLALPLIPLVSVGDVALRLGFDDERLIHDRR